MMNYKHIKKIISIVLIGAFLFQVNICLQAQSEGEIVRQFQRAKNRYLHGQYVNAKTRIERIITLIIERNIARNDILGGCYLLMGAIYEKEGKQVLAEENYRKAKETYGIMLVEGVNLDSLPLYRKVVKGEGVISEGTIVKEGKKKKKKFPWLLAVGGVVVVGVVVYFLFLKSKKYQLSVDLGEGVEGNPPEGTYTYKKGSAVNYSFQALSGYSNLEVRLNGSPALAADTIVMDRNHTLTVTASANVVEFVTDKDRVEVGEGSTADFNVWLSAQPGSEINVTVNVIGGDSDISMLAGGNLVFTPSQWNTPQTVLLQAAEDLDTANGEATIRISAPGITDKDITAAEIDNDSLQFITNINRISIWEGSTEDFKVKLSAQPSSNITAEVNRVSGDSSISVKSGPLNFTPTNWHIEQKVTLEAAQDEDTVSGEAIIRISGPGAANKDITAAEIDDDSLQLVINADELPIEIQEGGTAEFQVKLSAAPTSNVNVTVSRVSGDSDITIQSSSTMTFTPANWDTYQTVTLAASQDEDSENGSATIRISAAGLAERDIEVQEVDDDMLQFVTNVNEVTIVEDQTAEFQVKLLAKPLANVTASIRPASGDSDITVVSGSSLTFTPDNWETYQTVTLQAARDEDEEDGVAQIIIEASGIPSTTITAREQDTGPGDPPEISIDEPKDGEPVSDDVTIKAVASDDFGIKKVEFYIDSQLEETDEDLPYWYKWSTTEVTTGPHQIKVIAYDAIEQTDEDEISVTVEDNPPTVEITPPTGTPLSGTVTIDVHAEDYKGVQSIQIYVDNSPLTSWNQGPQTGVDFSFQLNTTAYANGTHTLKAVAVDTASQESQPAEITIVIEN